MNYGKLTLAVTAGILLAAAIILAIIEIPEYQRRERVRARYLAENGRLSGPDGPFARAKKTVGSDPDKIPVAAANFCTETAWPGAAEERRAELFDQCLKDTSRHLAEEMK